MYSVAFYKHKKEMFVLASGNGNCVDVIRLSDFKESGYTSKSLRKVFCVDLRPIWFTFRPICVGKA